MSELVPVPFGGSSGPALQRLRAIGAQPAVRAALPWFAGFAMLGGAALAWSAFAPETQRVLYAQLGDAERASVVEALEKASIGYTIDNATGALTVGEGDLYKARMTVAADGALATPDLAGDPLASLPLGASRTLEGRRLNTARERELMLSIAEIDGVEAVRVHLGEAEKSAFIRDNAAASASVMLRLARGRQLSQGQVSAIVNLVAGSVPGLALDAVKVIDQQGRLLSDRSGNDSGRIDLQARIEDALHAQLTRLLSPMIGEGNFSAQVHADLDMDEVTTARESYDKQGVLRSESQQQSQTSGAGGSAFGVPGVLSNTPPPQTVAQPGAPAGTAAPAGAAPAQTNGDSSATRTYELGREVAVANSQPGKIRRLSVAVALSATAMKGIKPAELAQLKQLVAAAVGADPARGDDVAVMVRKFEVTPIDETPFYETGWFAMALRYGAALVAMLLVLLLAVRPLIRTLRRDPGEAEAGDETALAVGPAIGAGATPTAADAAVLGQQISLAQQMVAEQPESAIVALRQMLQTARPENAR